ncbi:hypothetical protein EX30DRAFT_343957 [Ascodesmis nigricans]|uniref:Uncharacterized protein n=1 Tax=Ascodesmis nigricans TaxID=341454 RepID=A0A4S2ML05_9PEZI|nr:hypothetical protein EX30DRAFT_343957 [Ascodesmis nigricans]
MDPHIEGAPQPPEYRLHDESDEETGKSGEGSSQRPRSPLIQEHYAPALSAQPGVTNPPHWTPYPGHTAPPPSLKTESDNFYHPAQNAAVFNQIIEPRVQGNVEEQRQPAHQHQQPDLQHRQHREEREHREQQPTNRSGKQKDTSTSSSGSSGRGLGSLLFGSSSGSRTERSTQPHPSSTTSRSHRERERERERDRPIRDPGRELTAPDELRAYITHLEQRVQRRDYENHHLLRELHGSKQEQHNTKKELHFLQQHFSQLSDTHETRVSSLRDSVRTAEKKFEDLLSTHASTVIGMGTGLESISDDTFEKKIAALQTAVRELCRRPSVGRKVDWDAEVFQGENWRGRVKEGRKAFDEQKGECWFKPNHAMQAVTWIYLEEKVFKRWYPEIGEEEERVCRWMEQHVRNGDKSEHQQKAAQWLALTRSRLFTDNSLAPTALLLYTHLDALHALYTSIFPASPPSISAIRQKLTEVLTFAIKLVCEMRCQRGEYVLDDELRPIDRYEAKRMTEATMKEGVFELEGRAEVELVIARRWERRGNGEKVALGKGLVLVSLPDGEADGGEEE